MRIVVDAMGSDNHPKEDVAGAVMAARESGDTIILVGLEDAVKRELDKYHTQNLKLEVVHAGDSILMADKPSLVGKTKPNSPMHLGMAMVKEGLADAFVTMGNTGAAHAIAMLHTLRRIPGVKRPALSTIFPIYRHPVIFLDIGANTDSKPEWLAQFALMGSIYAKNALGRETPRVGLLSNGEEEGKGNQLVHEADDLIKNLRLNYVGNVEPKDIMRGQVDVVVSDGFTGNILIKTFEASTRYLANIIRDELTDNVFSAVGGLLARPAFNRARNRIDTFEIGGAPLLGVNGIVIIGHGRSNSKAIRNAIYQAHKAVQGRIVEAIQEKLAHLSLQMEKEEQDGTSP